MIVLLLSGLLINGASNAQLKIVKAEKIPLDNSRQWTHPKFSLDGKRIYFTTSDWNGIWEFSLASKASKQITADPQSGSAFEVSPDGSRIAYRRTVYNKKGQTRKQEIVVKSLLTGAVSVVASGSDVSQPIFSQNSVVYSTQGKTKNLSPSKSVSEIRILGIENTKIALNRNGKKELLDPFGNGSYIWPSLSPDKKKIVVYEMDRGAIICDLDGRILTRLGKRNAPSWTRSGKSLVYMNDKDDGHQILSSELYAISLDGRINIQLTFTDKVIELHPQCSPTESKIVCSSYDGELFVLTYEEQ